MQGGLEELANLFYLLQSIDGDHGEKHDALNFREKILVPVFEVE